ncbi:MAG: ribonuclease H family protein [Saprospiraceae bacterium]|nr:ribonuclease H family protein [Saprospiraceae bacterium]
MAKQSKKYYVVWQGHTPGIYDSWTDCQLQIKAFPNAQYKSFDSRQAAEAAFKGNYWTYAKTAGSKPTPKPASRSSIVWESISVDAACSGNPGVMEYQGVDTSTGHRLFHKKFNMGTNNIGEFLAIVHALALLQKEGKRQMPIYSDSVNAMKWVKQKKAKTKLELNAQTAELHEVIKRAENWLAANTYDNPLLKWETESWGEIPADFGRK